MYRILIVEDDSTIAEALKRHLEGWDHETVIAEDFKNIMLSLPGWSRTLCSWISAFPLQRILLVQPDTAGFGCADHFISSASDNMNIVMAMNMGGDEFIEKPFDLHVVTAKVQAILRRAYSYRGSASLMEYRGCILNLADATVTYQNRKTDLTKNEFKIFQCLLECGKDRDER